MGTVQGSLSVESSDIYLTPNEQDNFFSLIESSMRVNSMQQFFLWTQGELQSLISHEVLLVGALSPETSQIEFQKFSSSRYFDDQHFLAVSNGQDSLLNQMMLQWLVRQSPSYLCAESSSDGVKANWLQDLQQHEMRNFIAHGVLAGDRRVWTFFVLSRLKESVSERQAYMLNLLMPYLHSTYVRVLEHTHSPMLPSKEIAYGDIASVPKQFSKREIEVLTWLREGKTNWEIAQILSLSPLTIKNHVQRILRKLGVSNRCHAVSMAAQLGVLKR